MIKKAEGHANQRLTELLVMTHQQSKATLQDELSRLEALQRHNPNIREVEINFFKQQLEQLETLFESAQLRLDGLRVIVTT